MPEIASTIATWSCQRPRLHARQHADRDAGDDRPDHRAHGQPQRRHEALADQLRHRLVRLDRTAELQLHAYCRASARIAPTAAVSAPSRCGPPRRPAADASGPATSRAGSPGSRCTKPNTKTRDGQQHRNGAGQPPDQIGQHRPAWPDVSSAPRPVSRICPSGTHVDARRLLRLGRTGCRRTPGRSTARPSRPAPARPA